MSDSLPQDPLELAAWRLEGLVDEAQWQAARARLGPALDQALEEHQRIAQAIHALPRPQPAITAPAIIAQLPAPRPSRRRDSAWWIPLAMSCAACLFVAFLLVRPGANAPTPAAVGSPVAVAAPPAPRPPAGGAERVLVVSAPSPAPAAPAQAGAASLPTPAARTRLQELRIVTPTEAPSAEAAAKDLGASMPPADTDVKIAGRAAAPGSTHGAAAPATTTPGPAARRSVGTAPSDGAAPPAAATVPPAGAADARQPEAVLGQAGGPAAAAPGRGAALAGARPNAQDAEDGGGGGSATALTAGVPPAGARTFGANPPAVEVRLRCTTPRTTQLGLELTVINHRAQDLPIAAGALTLVAVAAPATAPWRTATGAPATAVTLAPAGTWHATLLLQGERLPPADVRQLVLDLDGVRSPPVTIAPPAAPAAPLAAPGAPPAPQQPLPPTGP